MKLDKVAHAVSPEEKMWRMPKSGYRKATTDAQSPAAVFNARAWK